ncbi:MULTISPECIES: HNH endonuclease [Pseudomonas]|jgi:5-methylcytosine-specific restriction endonuclease McrA|uniref:HNH endonuclease n=1 Tax=Pseudomonas TaxID=286 RepID=UPI0009B87EA3|nr:MULTISPECIES: HNH endonuclease [Pseudomonas]
MKVWRLVAHHEDSAGAIEEMKQRSRIAIGWSKIGDLRGASIDGSRRIGGLISRSYPELKNSNFGGPSLWNLYKRMSEGDLVIVTSKSKRCCVFEVVGPYIFESDLEQIKGYGHQRSACLTSIDAEALWKEVGGKESSGQNSRWTLFECDSQRVIKEEIFEEGRRWDIRATAIERNPEARAACIDKYGSDCFVCGFNFGKVYGDFGKGYIHVHHRVDISTRYERYKIDPVEDLVPLCPNCHAMVHTQRPSMSVEELKDRYQRLNKNAVV